PDAQLGAAASTTNAGVTIPAYRTYQFGIYNPARPLLGEPAMQLPNRTCIDMTPGMSSPDGSADLAASRDYDILFAPSGQLAYTVSTQNAGHVFLWVRNPRMVQNFAPPPNANGTFTYNLTNFERGGEMMIVAIKARGAIGVAPATWPASATAADTTT